MGESCLDFQLLEARYATRFVLLHRSWQRGNNALQTGLSKNAGQIGAPPENNIL